MRAGVRNESDTMPGVKFCPECGDGLIQRHIDGRIRGACEACRVVDWGDHRVSVGVVIRDEDSRVLLGRRAEQPSLGLWALPSGYVEGGETLADAAVREAREEVGVEVTLGSIVAVRSMAAGARHGTYVVFVAELTGGVPTADQLEFSEVAWFRSEELEHNGEVTPVTRRMTLSALEGLGGLHRRHYVRSDQRADLYLSHEAD